MTRQEAMDVYKDRSSKFRNTQSIQWKMNLSIWTLLVLAIFHKTKMNLPTINDNCLTWGFLFEIVVALFVIFVHGYFCYKIQKSLNDDKAVMDQIAAELNKGVNEKADVPVDLKAKSNTSPWSWIFIQNSITSVLALIFCISY